MNICAGTGAGVLGFGVGAGVLGLGAGAGVLGLGAGAGVLGLGAGAGVFGLGTGAGVLGLGAGAGVFGLGAGAGVLGLGAGVGVFGLGVGAGALGFGAGAGVLGAGAGVLGLGAGAGVLGAGTGAGVLGFGAGAGALGAGTGAAGVLGAGTGALGAAGVLGAGTGAAGGGVYLEPGTGAGVLSTARTLVDPMEMDTSRKATKENEAIGKVMKTKEDDVAKISTSIFVTNFPESFSAKDLLQSCKQYGHVVDTFIPNKRSKADKRFGFVRFINVFNDERLVNNLCTIWNDHLKLHANITRFNRAPLKENNIREKEESKDLFRSNVGAGSWFSVLQPAEYDFTVEGRIVWVEVEEIMEVSDDDEQSVEDVKGGDTVVHDVGNHGEDSDVDEQRKVNSHGDMVNGESLKYPPGFTPIDATKMMGQSNENVEKQNGNRDHNNNVEEPLNGRDDCSDNMGIKPNDLDSGCSGRFKKSMAPRTGGSILCLMEEVVKETKMESMELITIKSCWGNYAFDYVHSDAVGNLGGILCVRDTNEFCKTNCIVSDYFVIVRGVWVKTGANLLIDREVMMMGDFNEVGFKSERFGSFFNERGADMFNSFISNASLEEVPLGGCAYTWCHKSASKMSKLDRFLISENLMHKCPNMCAITLDRFISDHRAILLRESSFDYGPTPFRFFHIGWKEWINVFKNNSKAELIRLKGELQAVDGDIDYGNGSDKVVSKRTEIINSMLRLNKIKASKAAQKAKIKWSVEKDENLIFFHGMLNKNRSQLSIRGVMADGVWIENPNLVKDEFVQHFSSRFGKPTDIRASIDMNFPKVLSTVQKGGAGMQILDGPFILNEVMHWCTVKKKQALIFKVDFEKAYNSVRWDFLDEVLQKFSFGNKWRMWIQSSLKSSRGSILVNGSPTEEFQFYKGNWNDSNINTLVNVLECFYRASGLRINMCKSKIMGVHVEGDLVKHAASKLGCLILSTSFVYLGTKVGGKMSRVKEWNEVVDKVVSRYIWSLEGSGDFSVVFIRKVIDDKFLPNVISKTRWVICVPIKVNILALKVKMDALSVRFNLSRRGIDIGSIVCPVCESGVETASHLFFKFSLLRQIARKVSSWWNVDYVDANSYEEWLD
nr:RNA-directed DNA polymerase, eukaryota [Tanacetum cinerariifolium]